MPSSDASTNTTNPRTSKLSRTLGFLVEALLWLMLVGWVAALLIPALAPTGRAPGTSAKTGIVIGILVVTFFLAKRRHSRRPWVCVIFALVGYGLIDFTGKVRHANDGSRAAKDELYNAIDKFDPTAAAELRKVRNDQGKTQKILTPVLFRVIARAPDSSLLEYDISRLMLTDPATPEGLARCVAVAKGNAVPTSGLSPQMLADQINGIAKLVRNTVGNAHPVAEPDPVRAEALMRKVYGALDRR